MSAGSNFGVSEGGLLRLLVKLGRSLKGISRMFQCLARSLLARQMFLLPMLLGGGAMGMCGAFVQFRGSLVIFIMRSIVIARRHITASRSARI